MIPKRIRMETPAAKMENRRISALRLLGLAKRAGAVAAGTGSVRRAIQEGEALLILMAEDASSVQMNKIRNTNDDESIPRVTLGDRATLGSALGMAELSAVAVTQSSFADRLVEELSGSRGGCSTNALEA